MTTTTLDAAPGAAAPLSLPARFVGVLMSPRATYADVAARPRWAGMLAAIVLLGAAASFVFFSTTVGQNAMLDQQVTAMESWGMTISDEMYSQMQQRLGSARYTAPLFQSVGIVIMGAVVAGLMIAVFNAIMGGTAAFKQVYAVVVHSGVVMTVSQLFILPLSYARESMSGATNLGVFFPFLDEGSFAAQLLGSVDLFIIWWLISLAIGLGVLYRRRTGPIANSLVGTYVTIGFVVAAVKTAVSGA
jgi:hypothetical protein